MDALILAGGKDKNNIGSNNKFNNKALLLLNGVPMIEYIVDAICKSHKINNIVIVGPQLELSHFLDGKVNKILDSTDSIVNNLKIGLDYIKSDKIFVSTADIPLISGTIIDNFIEKSEKYEAFLYYPFIRKETILEKYPDTVRSYASLKEGFFCGGNVIIFSKAIFEKNKNLLNEVYEKRKDVKKYINLLGMKFIIKYLCKTLTIEEIEKRAAEIVGFPVKGILIDNPEIMIDLDKLSDYELILRELNKNN
ncbi:MAG: NTP transferase domain-containing protein [Atribacterota bacterium]|nr:NTP transferase domain-containing protein [Atribacterota bacterium]